MTVDIRELDLSPTTLSALLPVFQAVSASDAPLHPEPDLGFLTYVSTGRVNQHRAFVAAFDDGVPIGYGCLIHNLTVNQDMVFTDVWILPEHRADTAAPLLEAFKAYARNRDATRFVSGFSEIAAESYAPVFTAAGGRQVDRDRRAQVDLKTIDRAKYAEWAAPTEKNAQYRIEHWLAPTPDDLLPALVQAAEAMNDAPNELGLEHAPPDVERRRGREAQFVEMGMRMHVIAAFTADGEIAGLHEVLVVPGFRMADVFSTGVPERFRGHGLGLRLKADLALRLLDAEPHVDTIGTWNNAGNAPMVRVNDTLGYYGAEVWETWQFDL